MGPRTKSAAQRAWMGWRRVSLPRRAATNQPGAERSGDRRGAPPRGRCCFQSVVLKGRNSARNLFGGFSGVEPHRLFFRGGAWSAAFRVRWGSGGTGPAAPGASAPMTTRNKPAPVRQRTPDTSNVRPPEACSPDRLITKAIEDAKQREYGCWWGSPAGTREWLKNLDCRRGQLGIGERTLWRWSRSGIAPAPIRIGCGSRLAVRYRRQDLLQWIDAGCPRCDEKGGDR